MRTAHGLGIRSSATIMFGHVDAPPHWVAHLRRIASIQRDTGGFTEFVPLPFVHRNAPIYLAGHARPGPTFEDSVRMHAWEGVVGGPTGPLNLPTPAGRLFGGKEGRAAA